MTPQLAQILIQDQLFANFSPMLQLHKIKQNLQLNLLLQINNNIKLREEFEAKNKKNSFQANIRTQYQSQSEFSCFEQQSSSIKNKKKNKKIKEKAKNDTKNIPKNFGKAIITFIEQKQEIVSRALKITGVNYQQFVNALKPRKRNLYSIAELRSLWIQKSFIYSKQMRILSLHFLRKGCMQYIFGSRIFNYAGHIKYRNRFIDVLKNPKDFTFIKT